MNTNQENLPRKFSEISLDLYDYTITEKAYKIILEIPDYLTYRLVLHMRLEAFRVQNYKRIADTGLVSCRDLTVFVGKNESGKSAIWRLFPNMGFR